MYQGRVNIMTPELNNQSLPLFSENNPQISSNQAVKSILTQNDPLFMAFFSEQNINTIQKKLKQKVYQESDGRHTIGNQSVEQLQIIMHSIYLQYGKFQNTNIQEQVTELNELIYNYAVPNILTNIEQYLGYKRDVSTISVPLEHPVNLNEAGLKMYIN